jgi:hypothetical protein
VDQPNVNANASGSVSHLHDMVATALDLMKNDLEKPFREASPLKAMFLFIFPSLPSWKWSCWGWLLGCNITERDEL